MSSINTNLSAMTALQSLKATQTAMNKNQSQISTGLRVSEASHNASYWSISTAMKSDNGALSAVKDSIKQSKAMIDTFTSAMDKSLTYLNKMKAGLVAASQPGADLAKIQNEFNANIEGMKSAAGSASFNGQNWLAGASEKVNIVTSYDGVANKVGTLEVDTANTVLFTNAGLGTGGLLGDAAKVNIGATAATVTKTATTAAGGEAELALKAADLTAGLMTGRKLTVKVGSIVAEYEIKSTDTTLANVVTGINGALDAKGYDGDLATAGKQAAAVVTAGTDKLVFKGLAGEDVAATLVNGDIAKSLATIDKAIADVSKGSATLGANKALLETQEEFIGALSDSLTAGVSAFIDADMNEASTRNQALQTQQQLGVQALSMANQNSQMILKLFQ
jgi:flagellin